MNIFSSFLLLYAINKPCIYITYIPCSAPIDKSTFLRHLWSALHTLEDKAGEDGGKPAYFRFLTLLGFKIFLETQVDVAILEVGLGGRLDATNCVKTPVVCGVTPLGFDHMELLGYTLPEIAREKAGIFKPSCPAYTTVQREDAAAALQEVADRVGAPLAGVKPLNEYGLVGRKDKVGGEGLEIGLAGEHQRENAALAVALAAAWEEATAAAGGGKGGGGGGGGKALQRAAAVRRGELPAEYVAGLQAATWPGRGQIVEDPAVLLQQETTSSSNNADSSSSSSSSSASSSSRLTFFLDGAHTAESMATCGRWFADAVAAVPQRPELMTHRVLLFNCMQERDPTALLQPLISTLDARGALPQHALFVPPESHYMKLGKLDEVPELLWQLNLRHVWVKMNANLNDHHHTTNSLQNGGGGGGGVHQVNGSSSRSTARGGVLPRLPALPAVVAAGVPAVQDAAAGAVLPSLQHTLEWLRRCVRETPSMRMQVLVTGSLYLVGDVLRLLGTKSS